MAASPEQRLSYNHRQGDSPFMLLPGEIRNKIYEHCLQFGGHSSTRLRQDAPKHGWYRAALPTIYLHRQTNNIQRQNFGMCRDVGGHRQQRDFIGLTQANRRIRTEFLAWYQDDLEVNIWLTDIKDYIETFFPSGSDCSKFVGTIHIEIPTSNGLSEWIDLRPLFEFVVRAPNAKVDFWSRSGSLGAMSAMGHMLRVFAPRVASTSSPKDLATVHLALPDPGDERRGPSPPGPHFYLDRAAQKDKAVLREVQIARGDLADGSLDAYRWSCVARDRFRRELNKALRADGLMGMGWYFDDVVYVGFER